MIANHEIERALLAVAIQHDGDFLGDLSARLFDAKHNRTLFGALQELYVAGKPLDEPTLVSHLEREGTLADAGGKAGITALYYHDTALRSSVPSYVEELEDAYRRRSLSIALASLAREAEKSDDKLDHLIERVETQILQHTRRVSGSTKYIDAATMATSALDLIEAARSRGDGLVGHDTGIPELNNMVGGWEPGTFTIIMGPPGVGKTALWLQSALHVAKDLPIAIVQLEMTPAKMGMRALSNQGRLSFRTLRRGGDLTEREWHRLSDTVGHVAGRKAMIAPSGISEWADIKAWFRRMHLDHGAKMLFLDNIKIVGMKDVKPLDRFNAITRELKILSHELNVPICAIHHLHRLEDGTRPSLTSGYGSSSIEQDADNVIALWKPEPDFDEDIEILPLKTRDDFSRPVTVTWQGDLQLYRSKEPEKALAGDEPIPVPYADA